MDMMAITLIGSACAFALMGCGALWQPLWVTRQFGLHDLSRPARNEIRSVYGGFGLLMAAVLLIAFLEADRRPGICLAVAAALGGMALGRLVSWVIDRGIDRGPACYLVLEMAVASALYRFA